MKSEKITLASILILVLVTVYLYSLGSIHRYACVNRNQGLLSLVGATEQVMSISYKLGTEVLGDYMPLTDCTY
ncbi:MAG: hypothetical protein Q7R49_02335 [Candidatus Daviesbacteria bacterium]|nr:hypothetical protein [Candidatus Daviesbacteria bacterium]